MIIVCACNLDSSHFICRCSSRSCEMHLLRSPPHTSSRHMRTTTFPVECRDSRATTRQRNKVYSVGRCCKDPSARSHRSSSLTERLACIRLPSSTTCRRGSTRPDAPSTPLGSQIMTHQAWYAPLSATRCACVLVALVVSDAQPDAQVLALRASVQHAHSHPDGWDYALESAWAEIFSVVRVSTPPTPPRSARGAGRSAP
jgi:hypothetical protein